MRTWLAVLTLIAAAGIPLPSGVIIAQEAIPTEQLLPENTRAWVSVPSAPELRAALERGRIGQMTDDPEVKPFVDDLIRQFREYLNEQNVQFGMKVTDIEDVATGEICMAGVLNLPPASAEGVPPEHAVILMVDVGDTTDKAKQLLTRINEEFKAIEATIEPLQIGEIEVTRITFKQPQGLRETQYAWHGIVGRWLVACDNESVFREMIDQIAGARAGETRHLADNPAFQKITDECQFAEQDFPIHVRWFIEPFGYMYLAEAIADARNGQEPLRNDYARILKDEGFSAIRGVGGVASFSTGEHEAVHRTFIHVPVTEEQPLQRAAAMLDFSNDKNDPLNPPAWVPEDAASYLTFTWDLGNALDKIGLIPEALTGKPGSWERTLDGIRDDLNGPRVDLRKLVACLEDRITVAAVTKVPIDENSERILIGIRILEEEAFVEDSVFRLVRNDAEVVEYEGNRIFVVDTTEEDSTALPEIEADPLEAEFDRDFGNPGVEEGVDEEEEEFPRPKPLFEKRVFAVRNGILLIGNNLEQVQSVLSDMDSAPGERLAEANDYERVAEALVELAGDTAPSFRQFGRMDRSIRTNYEMLRTGRMGQSKTLLAQLLNRAWEKENAGRALPEDSVRTQQIDGSKMPEDFEGKVARYFGPTGMVLQTVDEGWLITGCVLAKEEATTSTNSAATGADDSADSKRDTATPNPGNDSDDDLPATDDDGANDDGGDGDSDDGDGANANDDGDGANNR
jgi:hypothetical protein